MEIWYEGFFTITSPVAKDFYVLLPKIHHKRCLLTVESFKVKRTVKKRSKKYELTIDKCFQRVCGKVVEQFGHNWLCPPLIKVLFDIHQNNGRNFQDITVHSVELWKGNRLVAGELGVIIGTIYTSLTGFKLGDEPGCGSVQLYSLFSHLFTKSIDLIDLGELPSKLMVCLNFRFRYGNGLQNNAWSQTCSKETLFADVPLLSRQELSIRASTAQPKLSQHH